MTEGQEKRFNDELIVRDDLPRDAFLLLFDLAYDHEGRERFQYRSRAQKILMESQVTPRKWPKRYISAVKDAGGSMRRDETVKLMNEILQEQCRLNQLDLIEAYGASQYEAGKLAARASESSPPQPECAMEGCDLVARYCVIHGAAAPAPSAPAALTICPICDRGVDRICDVLAVQIGTEWYHKPCSRFAPTATDWMRQAAYFSLVAMGFSKESVERETHGIAAIIAEWYVRGENRKEHHD